MKKSVFIPVLFILFLTFKVLETKASIENIEPRLGTITDTVRCNANPKFSYTLYLPKNYSNTSKWPLICIFDPGARSKLAITHFIQAAEKSGYVLVCSNQSRNGMSWNEYLEIANHILDDAKACYSIDFSRIYTSGFSGGSRAATFVAMNNRSISGVIACGAGFPEIAPDLNFPRFDYYGLVGTRDMNYLEMCELEEKLIKRGINNELRIFNGDHNWPSPDQLQDAVDWFDLQAMKKGTKPKNLVFTNSQFNNTNNRAALLLKQGKLIESARYYASTIKEFPDHDATKLKVTLDSLLNSKAYQKLAKEWNKTRSQELEIQNKLMTAFQGHILLNSLTDSIRNWWGLQIKMMRNMEDSRDTLKQEMGSRLLNLLSSVCYETARETTHYKKFRSAVNCYQISLMIAPENKNIHYLLAKVYSLDQDTKNSLKYLEKAIKLGYNNRQSIEKEPAFAPLLNEKRFREMMTEIK